MESQINSIVRRILKCGISLKGTRNLSKKKKNRLRKSLEVQVRMLLAQNNHDDDDIVKKLADGLLLKYGSSKHDERQSGTRHIYHEERDLYITESDDESILQKQEISKIETLQDEKQDLEIRLQRSNRTLIRQKEMCESLLRKNYLLSFRSKELTRMKLVPSISPRSLLIGDNALFSDFYGYVDQLLLETEVDFLEETESMNVFSSSPLRTTSRHVLRKIVFENGEMAILKGIKKSLTVTREQCFAHIAYEAKIIKLVGKHENILDLYGISMNRNLPYLTMAYESASNLEESLKSHKSNLSSLIIKHILSGLCKGVSHIHSKDIIHNNLMPENICLKSNSHFVPVILGFSRSCRVPSSKPLTRIQTEEIKDNNYMPSDVKAGIAAPTKISDIFSYGRIIQRICALMGDNQSKNDAYDLGYKCLYYRNDPDDFEATVLSQLEIFKE